ncbi:hypothetical protein AGLY_016431 [Aphis glycines]|uniref:Endonuclease/exonuclease/phosphatase domain-containing protein n=1 Tax=Aphis glycines TaxID=307491 RepID=A0A6G0SYH1_APHGL|nr:hypothetical protein AGLY_016431 [Aphis glycines]
MTNQADKGEGGTTLKIVQAIMARTATANEDLLLYAQREKVDVALLQEPYVRYGRLVGLEASLIRIILAPGFRNRRGHNIIHGATIVVFNPALAVLARDDLTCDNFAVATVSTTEGSEINLISAYFKYRDPTAGLINTLRRIKRACGNKTLIAADINAFSTDWFSKRTDHRGILVESFIQEEQLQLANRVSPLFTFSGPRGENNIDITLTTMDLFTEINDWKVIDGEITSNHRLIAYNIGRGKSIKILKSKKRFATDKADWVLFNAELVTRLNQVRDDLQHADLESRTELLMDAIN